MKIFTFLALLSTVCHLSAADKPAAHADPFAGAFFPPELIMQAGEQIGLTQEQRQAIEARAKKTMTRSDELRATLEHETAALSALLKQDRVEEATLLAQFDKLLDAEREVKHLHIGLLVSIKNSLTPEQQTKLRELAKDGGASLAQAVRQRLSAKVERVKEGAQKWADSGRDPSEVLRAMEEKFKPLMESGKAVEAEAELDEVLKQVAQDAK